jgi:hypothetical protein
MTSATSAGRTSACLTIWLYRREWVYSPCHRAEEAVMLRGLGPSGGDKKNEENEEWKEYECSKE